jgi:hypothetical protein
MAVSGQSGFGQIRPIAAVKNCCLDKCGIAVTMAASNLIEGEVQDGSALNIVHLVHGTWGNFRILGRPKAARWHEPGHPFFDKLQAALKGRATVEGFGWGWGANLQASRIRAARRLGQVIRASDPETRHVLIGHSHGGNICLQACADPKVAERVTAIVTMATPFLVFRRAKYLYGVALAWLVVLTLGLMEAGGRLGIGNAHPLVQNGAVVLVTATITIGLLLLRAGEFPAKDLILPKALPCEILVLRSAADEASGMLDVAAPLSWAVLKAHRAASVLIGIIGALPVLLLIGGMIVLLLIYSSLEQFHGWIDRGLWVAGVALALAYGGAFLTICALRLPFGWDLAFRGFRYSVSSEAAPPGSWQVELFESPRSNEPAFAHSGIYNLPAVQAKVIATVRSAIGAAGAD